MTFGALMLHGFAALMMRGLQGMAAVEQAEQRLGRARGTPPYTAWKGASAHTRCCRLPSAWLASCEASHCEHYVTRLLPAACIA